MGTEFPERARPDNPDGYLVVQRNLDFLKDLFDAHVIATLSGSQLKWNVSTSPPGAPANNDLWIYPGSGFYWMFLYDSTEATYKWKFVGGPDIQAVVSTDQTFTSDGTFKDPATAGPTITLPRAGDFEVETCAQLYNAGQTTGGSMTTGALASSGTWDGSAAGGVEGAQGYTEAGVAIDPVLLDTLRGVSSSATVKLQYAASAALGGTSHTRFRVIKARPIRII